MFWLTNVNLSGDFMDKSWQHGHILTDFVVNMDMSMLTILNISGSCFAAIYSMSALTILSRK